MAMVTSVSTYNENISNTLSYGKNITRSRDASFSSHLNGNEEAFVLELAESAEVLSPAVPFPIEPFYQASLGRKKPDGEISVFGAEQYFNGKMDEQEKKTRIREKVGMKHHPKEDDRIVVHQMKPNMRPGTPSTCSEVSWNSQRALLMGTVLREPSPGRQYKSNGKRFFSTLGCNCVCSGKKSVDIDEHHKENVEVGEVHGRKISKVPINIKQTTLPPRSWLAEENPSKNFDGFSFPTPNSGVENLKLERQFEVEAARKSLDVFGSPVLDKEDIALSLERRLNMLSWDANPRVEDTPAIPSTGEGMKVDDLNDSDSSSDLFEIKSLSSNPNPFLGRQGSDGMSGCMSPSTCYEPSEASIDWSVVTASATNFSVASDFDEQKSITTVNPEVLTACAKNTNTSNKLEMSKEVPKRRPGMLSGCRSHKAVKVVAEAHKISQKKLNERRPQRSDFAVPMSRLQAETKVTGFESVHSQHTFATRSVSQLRSVRASNSLYMH